MSRTSLSPAPVDVAGRVGQAIAVPLDENIGFQLRITSETLRAHMQRDFLPHGIRLAQWQYLRVLWHDDGLTQKELSRRARRVGANAVTVLNGLEADGYLRRVRNPADRRTVNVFLTKKGWALRDLLVPRAAAIHAQALTGFTPEEEALVLQFLKRMRANFGAM